MTDLSEAGAAEVDIEHAEETVERLADKRAPAVGAHRQRARRPRRREPSDRAPTPPRRARRLGVVLGRRRGRDGEQPGLGGLADQQVPGVRGKDTDDVGTRLDELVQSSQQDPAGNVHCTQQTTQSTDRRLRPRCCHLGSYFKRPKSSPVRPLACNWYYCAEFIAKPKAACARRFSLAVTSSNLGL